MKNCIKKAGCLLLAALLLAGTAACAKPAPPKNDQRLTVEELPVTYTTAFAKEIVPAYTDVVCRLMRLFGAPVLGESERAEIGELVQRDLLSSALRARLTEQELRSAITAIEAYCDKAEATTEERVRLQAFCHLYGTLVATVGTDRAGILAFDGTKMYLTSRITLCEERYREYQYSWYLEDAEAYRTKLKNLESLLCERSFTEAMGVLSFLGSFFTGAAPTQWASTEGLIYDRELLVILQTQAEHFATLSLSSEQWHVLFDLYSELEPKATDTPLKIVLSAWQREGTSAAMAESMPQLLALYHSFTLALEPQALSLLREPQSKQTLIKTLSCALAPCRDELLAFLTCLEPKIKTDGKTEEDGLRRLGHLGEYYEFLETTDTKTQEQLYEAIAACAAGTEGGEAAVEAALLGYVKGISPALAYTISIELKGVN